MKTKTFTITLIVLAILAIIAAWATSYAKRKSQNDPNFIPGEDSTGKGSTGTGSSVSLNYDKVLGSGSKGEEVKELQRLYNAKYPTATPLVVDGIFGPKTLNAVIVVMGFGVFTTTLNKFKAQLASK